MFLPSGDHSSPLASVAVIVSLWVESPSLRLDRSRQPKLGIPPLSLTKKRSACHPAPSAGGRHPDRRSGFARQKNLPSFARPDGRGGRPYMSI